MPPAVTLLQHPIHPAVTEVGAVAVQAEMTKSSKYSHLDSSYFFVPVAIETCGSFRPKTWEFFREVGRQVKRATQEGNVYECMTE